mmetsp:Transcript_6475/g.7034  ORF Transcript_6475/g.7034 Transcript_6475/m.7034 type:complete len:333 (+) Transcript_6475:75-1073(+)
MAQKTPTLYVVFVGTLVILVFLWLHKATPVQTHLVPLTQSYICPATETTNENCRTRLAVVIPFVAKQIPKIKKQIDMWADYFPCNVGWPCVENVTLFFAISLTHTEETKNQLREIVHESGAHSCFSTIEFFETKTPKQHDSYRPAASSYQFYEFFKRPEIKGNYDYWFLMEPDVLPVRPLWLEHVYKETLDVSPFWIKGSIAFRGACLSHPKHINKPCPPPANPLETRFNGHWFVHINGNAIYRIGDPEFLAFREDVIKIMGLKYFDSSMGEVMLRTNYSTPFWSFYASRFRYSEFIVHSARRSPQEQLEFRGLIEQGYYPSCHLIHTGSHR